MHSVSQAVAPWATRYGDALASPAAPARADAAWRRPPLLSLAPVLLLTDVAPSIAGLSVPQALLVGIALLAVLLVGVLLYRSRQRRLGAKEAQEALPGLEPPTAKGKLPPVESAAQRTARQVEEARAQRERALREGLSRTRGGFIARIGALLGRKKIDTDLLEQLEEILLTADIGMKTSQHLFEQVRATLSRAELTETDSVLQAIKDESRKLLAVPAAPVAWADKRPFVLLVVGVNGVGKTTTIGKLAAQQVAAGRKVMLAAGDTFRAAAAEQLEIWGKRSGASVVRGKEGGDPSSVVFDSLKRAQAEGVDVLIIDTAGRLHARQELMEELAKVRRVMKKAEPSAPHETWLVLDSTNGQNAIAQAAAFKEIVEITGIVLTKLDGTAKGGVILGICHEQQIPVRYIGIGEQVDDLRAFDADDFVEALYQLPQGEAAETTEAAQAAEPPAALKGAKEQRRG